MMAWSVIDRRVDPCRGRTNAETEPGTDRAGLTVSRQPGHAVRPLAGPRQDEKTSSARRKMSSDRVMRPDGSGAHGRASRWFGQRSWLAGWRHAGPLGWRFQPRDAAGWTGTV